MTAPDFLTDCDLSEPPAIDWASALAERERWLRTVIRNRLEAPEAAEEVWQEVSLAAWAQQAPLADPARLSAWLYRLAVRQALLYRRKQGRRRRLVDRYAAFCLATSRKGQGAAPEPLAWLLSDERRRLVAASLGRLPARDAEILLLKYTESWSYRDLAEHLGLTPAAVESRLHRARKRLRDLLAQWQSIEDCEP